MNKILLLAFLLFFASCGHKTVNDQTDKVKQVDTEIQKDEQAISETKKTAETRDYSGEYEYVYPHNAGIIENHYIFIEKVDSEFVGRYYGTSDEFDDAREGYYPGFFVAKMENLVIKNDTLFFTLNVPNSKILTEAVSHEIKTFEEAIEKGYENWPHGMKLSPKDYVGVFTDSETIFFKGEKEFMNKEFKKK